MPEPVRDYGLDNLQLTGRVLVAATVTCWLGAVLAYASGDELGNRRTHVDAVIVLLVLGVATLLAASIVLVELRGRRRAPEPRRDDYEDR